MNKKTISIILVIILMINFLVLAMGRANMVIFWAIIIISAIFAYRILPRMR